jgi:SNF2 family DNA or RNA helicase
MTQFATESGDSHPQLRQNGSDNDGGAIGGILADEPGLGKTLSVMALVIAGRKESRGLPTLIASPTPAIAAQCFGEVERSTEGLKVMHYRDSRMLNDEMKAAALVAELAEADIVLTDLGVVQKEYRFMKAQTAARSKMTCMASFMSPLFETVWRRVIVDEVQDVEGPTPPSWTTLRALSTEQRWGVSGTLNTSNGLEALRVLSFFLTLWPFCDSR